MDLQNYTFEQLMERAAKQAEKEAALQSVAPEAPIDMLDLNPSKESSVPNEEIEKMLEAEQEERAKPKVDTAAIESMLLKEQQEREEKLAKERQREVELNKLYFSDFE